MAQFFSSSVCGLATIAVFLVLLATEPSGTRVEAATCNFGALASGLTPCKSYVGKGYTVPKNSPCCTAINSLKGHVDGSCICQGVATGYGGISKSDVIAFISTCAGKQYVPSCL